MEEKIITNPIKAIRAKCLDCSNGSPNEVTLCPCTLSSKGIFPWARTPKARVARKSMLKIRFIGS